MLMNRDLSVVLASGSPARQKMLAGAGLVFDVEVSRVDEGAVRAALASDDGGVEPGDVAEVLARAKAEDVAARIAADVVIGADQVLSLGDRIFTKAEDMAAAREQLLELKGQTHRLHSAVAIVADDVVSFAHVETVDVTMRDYSPAFVGQYLSAAGDAALQSVGCYQLEGPGVQLIEKIVGDYFTVLGMPLMAVLGELRRLDVLRT